MSGLERANDPDRPERVTSPEAEGTYSLESCDLKSSWSLVHNSPGSHLKLPLFPLVSSLAGIMVHRGDSVAMPPLWLPAENMAYCFHSELNSDMNLREAP